MKIPGLTELIRSYIGITPSEIGKTTFSEVAIELDKKVNKLFMSQFKTKRFIENLDHEPEYIPSSKNLDEIQQWIEKTIRLDYDYWDWVYDMDAPFFSNQYQSKTNLGLDSLDVVEIIMKAETRFDIMIPDQHTIDFNTIGDLIVGIKTRLKLKEND